MNSLSVAVAGTILVVGLYIGPLYVSGKLNRISFLSQVIMESQPVDWDLQAAALDLASTLAAAASATTSV